MAPIGAARANLSRVPSFIPDSVVALYDARELTGFSDGDAISTWAAEVGDDISGEGTYRSSEIASQPAVDHDGSNDGFEVSFNQSVSAPYVVYIVLNPDFGSGESNVRSGWSEPNAGSPNLAWNGGLGTPKWELFAGSAIRGSTTADRRIISAKVDGSNSLLREDDTQTASGDAGTLALDLFSLGMRDDPNKDFFLGDIGYAEVHNQVPDAGFVAREQEIIDDWNLSV